MQYLSKIKLLLFLHYYMFAIWITQDYHVKRSALYLKHSLFIVLISQCNILFSYILWFTVSPARLL